MLFFAAAWRWIAGAFRSAAKAVAESRPLQYLIVALAVVAGVVFGVKRAVNKARKAGERAGRETILDKIEKDTKNVVQKIERAERQVERELGRPPVFEDRRDGKGLSTDDLNARELERLRQRSETDPRNRGNPRSTPRSDV